MGHSELTRDMLDGMDDMGAVCDRQATAYNAAQRAYDNSEPEDLDARDIRAAMAIGAAKSNAADALYLALSETHTRIDVTHGSDDPADVLAGLIGQADDDVPVLLLKAFRAAMGNGHPAVAGQRNAEAAHCLRMAGELLCERFAAAHHSAYKVAA